jgi:hypothetical protein
MNSVESFIDQIKRHLDESCETIDARTSVMIARARVTAIQEGTKRRTLWFWPALGLATAAPVLLAVVIAFHWALPKPAPDQVEVLEIVSSGKDLELFRDIELYQNLEFYSWLAENIDTPEG